MAFTLTTGYTWNDGDVITATRLNLLPTVAANQSYGFADGSAASPSIGFNSDADDGFYYIAANTFGVAAGGSNVGTWTTTGYQGAIGGTTPSTVAATTVAASSSILSTSPSAGVGYATGAGSTVTQGTDKSTTVTCNAICGQITMNAASLASSTSVSFAVNNSSVATTDVPVVAIDSGNTTNAYLVAVTSVSPGFFVVTLRNTSTGDLAEAVVLNFVVVKAVTS